MKIIKNTLFDQTHLGLSSNHVIKQYVCTCECMTYLCLSCCITAPMTSMNGMVLKLRNKKINPNLLYNDKQTCEQRKRNSKTCKKVKTEAY